MNLIARFIATGAGSGYVPKAPGTAGSILALIIYFLFPGLPGPGMILLIFCALAAGVWSAGVVEKKEGKDAQIIVIDEMAGLWITLAFLPGGSAWPWPLAGFILFRIFDILKPFPIEQSQRLPGGWGVMIDDCIAALMAGIILRLAVYIL